MAEKKMKKAGIPHAGHVDVIEPKTEEKASILAAGYGMTVEEARKIVAEREKDPHLWPWDEYKRAKAMLEAYEASPIVISKKEGWKRSRPQRVA